MERYIGLPEARRAGRVCVRSRDGPRHVAQISELITAPEFPEAHLAAYRAYYESDPPDSIMGLMTYSIPATCRTCSGGLVSSPFRTLRARSRRRIVGPPGERGGAPLRPAFPLLPSTNWADPRGPVMRRAFSSA